jgi:hypothetical protein
MANWPALPFAEWEKTLDTVHMWTQIVGKTRMAREPLLNHWWNVTLYVTSVGLGAWAIPDGDRTFDIEFDFVSHHLQIRASDGQDYRIGLFPRSVADFYTEYMAALKSLGIEIRINRTPSEFDDTTPYDEDQHHASYDTEYVERFCRILRESDRIFKTFRTRFIGKCSPVHFFWGAFDLAVTRFCGRTAPPRPGADHMMSEGYSHEVISCGFWPGDRTNLRNPAFYSYTTPAPAGLGTAPIRPSSAYWDEKLGEFLLKYDDVRTLDSPETAILDFCQSTYEAGANLANWDRQALER